jgi:hypothetical protein
MTKKRRINGQIEWFSHCLACVRTAINFIENLKAGDPLTPNAIPFVPDSATMKGRNEQNPNEIH